MAMWVDCNAYKEDCDINTLYQYLYHLSNMLAHRNNYYTNAYDYDSFALYVASKVYKRIENTKIGYKKKELKQIKSILNYLKNVIFYYKKVYDENFCSNIQNDEDFDCYNIIDLQDKIEFDRFSFVSDIRDIPNICRDFLRKIPRSKNSGEWINIYISCLLTLLNSMTLPNNTQLEESNKYKQINKILDKIREEEIILYHLDLDMSPYIRVLVNELRVILAQNLSWYARINIQPDSCTKDILLTQIDEVIAE